MTRTESLLLTEPHVDRTGDADAATRVAPDRRAYERLTPADLRWLRGARLKYGAELKVIDVSSGGMLIETSDSLAPDANVVIELNGPADPILVPSRVLRCRVAALRNGLLYEAAFMFKRVLQLSDGEPVIATTPATPTASASTPLTGATWQKVVARYCDGRVRFGYTNDFHPSKPDLHVSPDPCGENSVFIPLSQLKALFFVREFAGDPSCVDQKDLVTPARGRKVEITFQDDEVMTGSTLSFRGEGHGFFVQPVDERSNNLRVFVTAAGIRQMAFI